MDAAMACDAYSVVAHEDDVEAVRRRWPGADIPEGRSYRFEFSARKGDLLEVTRYVWGEPDHGPFMVGSDEEGIEVDGPAELAVSEEAGRFGAENLGLDDLIALRYPLPPKP
jgi:hypothetical protein